MSKGKCFELESFFYILPFEDGFFIPGRPVSTAFRRHYHRPTFQDEVLNDQVLSRQTDAYLHECLP